MRGTLESISPRTVADTRVQSILGFVLIHARPSATFGPIDIYLFDQILRKRIAPGMRVFDAGCGHGRNLVFFLNQGL